MTTTQTLRAPKERPVNVTGWNTHCASGHLWCAENERWRFRDRPERKGHQFTGWERDCLECRRASSGRGAGSIHVRGWLPGATK